MPAIHVPTYRKQKRSTGDLALVELEGVRHYLGTYDSPESREKYHQLLAEWSAGCAKLSKAVDETDTLIVAELCVKFWKHAETYYRKPDGLPTSELQNFKAVIRNLQELYPGLPVTEFGPIAFKAVRQRMVEHGLCRNTVNRYASRLKSIFKWGVEQEIVPASVWHGLQAVSGLRRGRTTAPETDPVRPVQIAHVDAVKNHVSRQVRALVELQILTGARPGELVIMRATDIETSGTVWIFRPADHKSAHHGFDREVYLGPQAQALVRNFMETRPIGSYLFSPIEAEHERHKAAEVHRRPDQRTNARKTARKLGERYTTASYRRAIERACKLAKVPKWHPHQLRHGAGTDIRRRFDVETARVVLGHRSIVTTETYAEMDREKAVAAIAKIG